MGRPALALGASFLLDKSLVNNLFTGATVTGPARGSLGLAPVVATASFPLINLPNFILASLS